MCIILCVFATESVLQHGPWHVILIKSFEFYRYALQWRSNSNIQTTKKGYSKGEVELWK
jgi:hypothetical protein